MVLPSAGIALAILAFSQCSSVSSITIYVTASLLQAPFLFQISKGRCKQETGTSAILGSWVNFILTGTRQTICWDGIITSPKEPELLSHCTNSFSGELSPSDNTLCVEETKHFCVVPWTTTNELQGLFVTKHNLDYPDPYISFNTCIFYWLLFLLKFIIWKRPTGYWKIVYRREK